MSTWGPGLFDNDLAVRVREAFDSALKEGIPPSRAMRKVIARFQPEMEDENDGAVIYLAIASLQVENSALESPIRAAALSIIDSGQAMEPWQSAAPDKLALRTRTINELRDKLTASS